MIQYLYPHYPEQYSSVAVVIISVAMMLFLGFLMTRITKKLKLPNVTAYIVTGILIGPFCLDLIPKEVVSGSEFLPDIALAFIAFSTGEFFRFSTIKQNGLKVVVITLFEALSATVLVFLVTHLILGLNLAFSIVLAALASATAPASTVMTIRQTGAKGDFEKLGLKEGDIVTLVGKRGEYKGSAQMTGAQYESHIPVTPVTIEEFLSKPDDKNTYYMVTGTISSLNGSNGKPNDYGNLYITDGTNELYVYGCYPGWGATGDDRKFFIADNNIQVGDQLTMIGYKDTYKGLVELCGGICFGFQHAE